MSSSSHTYGPTCHLAQSVFKATSKGTDDDIPDLKAQFFYSSALPIDDPLSAAPTPAGSDTTKHPPRPFSAYDNNILEEAWLSLASEKDRKSHFKGNPPKWATKDETDRRASILKRLAIKGKKPEEAKGSSPTSAIPNSQPEVPTDNNAAVEVLKPDGTSNASFRSRYIRRHQRQNENDKISCTVLDEHGSSKPCPSCAGKGDSSGHPCASSLESYGKRTGQHNSTADSLANRDSQQSSLHEQASQSVENTETSSARPLPPAGPAGITGLPFARVPSRKAIQSPAVEDSLEVGLSGSYEHEIDEDFHGGHVSEPSEETVQVKGCKAHKHVKEKDDIEIPVGISRLHLVKLPTLQMKPIYWSPIHDQASVTRGTWFYKDTMLPVEPPVANQLETGYRELRPWSQTWKDEIRSALEVGAVGEEKVVHRLWPKEEDSPTSSDDQNTKTLFEQPLSTDPYCAAKCFNGEAAATGTLEDEKPSSMTKVVKRYPYAQVLYKDLDNAFILKQSFVPSAYYGRKPVAKIMKGTTVGIHVTRGFDWKVWDKLHPPKKSAITTKAEENAPVAGIASASTKNSTCPACRTHEERPKVTDLVLVIHGIGQKLSERVESFHFTHAINAFRRSINVELGNEAVQTVLRNGLGGVMVLPVNWRSNLSFEDGGPKKNGDKDKTSFEDFTLKDITPNTIPAVRSLISDVMLDIPFYMSHHKPKMIQALITEANRVYSLWAQNNPGFHDNGRVHLIAHSLGSVMALDVLSKQPTFAPKFSPGKKINVKHFDFNTTNLFLVGSPAGFFLLLERGKLLPRKDRTKPDADLEDVRNNKDVTGEAGTFGSLAIDNIYNVMHYNDPIAYRLNATVDPLYAASLKDAQVPSATVGFFEAIGKVIKSVTPGVASPADIAVGQLAKPAAVQRLPSQLELEVHDFTREEIAEKKFYLLNDNGQVDWFLSSGGGPLEIQYLNMLGAHSSYWGSPDFIRMLVTEVGREPGKEHTLPNLRAIKGNMHKRK